MAERGVDVGGGFGEPVRRALRWMFLNRNTGSVTVAQWPNIPLGLFIVAALALRISHLSGNAERALRVVAEVAIIVWSLDELIRGVNPFRRMLGLGFLVVTMVGLIA